MNEQEFARQADTELTELEAAIEAAIDTLDLDIDLEKKPGGILELECPDGSKIIINRHAAAREIWVAARSGGFHFAWNGSQWRSGRDDSELRATIARCIKEQAGQDPLLSRAA